jgi:hypothetical protein
MHCSIHFRSPIVFADLSEILASHLFPGIGFETKEGLLHEVPVMVSKQSILGFRFMLIDQNDPEVNESKHPPFLYTIEVYPILDEIKQIYTDEIAQSLKQLVVVLLRRIPGTQLR